ncbi:hypothetical protein [Coprococcus eutactus]|jgi:hypothetical protein|uniref:hypothetical protein n=1 Tax=Coprococcus eutactus TaxID=33043 RepID=UPI003036EC58
MDTVAGLQLVIFMFFIFCSILVVILMCPLMDLVGKNKKIMTAINITTVLVMCLIVLLSPLLMNRLFDVTVTETRTKIDSGISYVEKATKDKTTYQAEVRISPDETVTADVSKEMFSRKPEQAVLIQCQLDKLSDGEKVILTDDENYDTTAIQKELIEDGEKSTWQIAVASASSLFVVGVFTLLLFSKKEVC